MSVSSD